MGPMNVTSISVTSLKNIYDNGDVSEISELRKQNNKRLEELLQQGRKEMNRRMKNESDAGTSANTNNSPAEKPDGEQIIRECDKSETLTEGCTEIQDPNTKSVKTNKFDWKQNDTESQLKECKLQVLPKKSEKLKECLFKNSELFEGTRAPKNKYRKRRQHADAIVDLSLNFQEKHKNTSKFSSEPAFMSSLLPVTNVWLQKRGVDLFPESQQTRTNLISCTTSTEENMLEMALAASLVTAAKEHSVVSEVAEEANQVHKSQSTASTFIPPKSAENENWDSDSTGSELASLDKDNYSYMEQNKTVKPHTNMQEVAKNNSRNKCSDIYNDKVKSLKNSCNMYKMFQSHENIEPTGAVSNKVIPDSKQLAVRITENSEVGNNIKNYTTKGRDQKCNNNNERTYISSECVNINRPQHSNNNKMQDFKHILKSKSGIKNFETDKMPIRDRLEEVQVEEETLIVKNRSLQKCLDVTVIDHKPLHETERVAAMKINFSNTSKQGGNFEIKNNKDLIRDKPSQEHVFKLNNPEIKNINHKTYYVYRTQCTEPKLTSGILPRKQEKPCGFETGSSKLINEVAHNTCEQNRSVNLNNVTYVKASANCPVQFIENNVMVDTGCSQETSSSNKLVEPLMQEVAIEQLLRYEPVDKDFKNTDPHHSSSEQVAPFMNPYSSKYPSSAMFQPDTIPLLQATWNPETNLSYNQFPTTDPHMKQAIPPQWVPYLSTGVSQQSAVIQAHIPPGNALMSPQLAFLNPSQYPGHNPYVSQPPGLLKQSDCVVKSNSPDQTRNKYEPILVPPPSSGTLCNPYFPVPAPQFYSQQMASKITHFDFQQHRKFGPVVQLECSTNNSATNQLTENLVSQDYGLPARLDSINPHVSQEVTHSQPLPPKAELYYQNLQNMIQVDLETLNQQMRNLLLQPGSAGLPQTSHGCSNDLGRQNQIQNTPQVMTTDQQNMTKYYAEPQWSQVGSTQSGMWVTKESLNSHHQAPPLMCGDRSSLIWQQAVVPFSQLSGQNHSSAALPQTSESTNIQGKGVRPITSLSLAAKGRGRYRNPNL